MKFLALLSSVSFESELLLSQLKNVRRLEITGKPLYRGRLSNLDILLMHTGIGKVNAAHSVTAIIERFSIKNVINFGVGGAYPDAGLKIGDIAVASSEIYGDDGVINLEGWRGMEEIGIPLVQIGRKRYFNEFSLDKRLLRRALNSALRIRREASNISQVKSGVFITLSAATGTYENALELERRFGAICENMEGAAIAHICALYRIPMLEVRGISNIAGVRDKRRWNISLASENCQRFVMEVIKSL